jgi:5,10-methylenetetrahydromethanopterin reductase
MRYGFAHIPADPVEARPGLVAFAEALGFDTAWIPDQTFYGDPYAVLGACALITTTIGLGIGITNPYTRHPAVTVRAAATVDALSGGRVRLGIGAGNQREMIRPLGLDGSHAATASLELIRLARGLLRGEPVTLAGRTVSTTGVRLEFATRPALPIYVAGRGPAVLRAAGRVADGVILSIAGFARAGELVREGAETAGRDPGVLDTVLWGECLPLDMPGADPERSRVRLGHVLGRAPEAGMRVMGLDDARIRHIKTAYAAGGPEAAAEHVTDEVLRAHLIVGTGEECRTQLRRFEALGVAEFACLMPPAPIDAQRRRLQWFADHIIAPMRHGVSHA